MQSYIKANPINSFHVLKLIPAISKQTYQKVNYSKDVGAIHIMDHVCAVQHIELKVYLLRSKPIN